MRIYNRKKAKEIKRNRVIYALSRSSLNLAEPRNKDAYDLSHVKFTVSVLEKQEKQLLQDDLDRKLNGISVVNEHGSLLDNKTILSYPEEVQRAYKLAKDLKEPNNFQGIPAADIIKTITDSVCQGLEDGASGYAVWSYGEAPTEFYLKWIINVESCRLLTLYLTGACHYNTFKVPKEKVKTGDIVVVESELDGRWYRAKVLEVLKFGRIESLYIDYGNVERCKIDRVRVLPVELASLPALAFKCSIYGRLVDRYKIEGYLVMDFLRAVKSAKLLPCEVISYKSSFDSWQVKLKLDGEAEKTISELGAVDEDDFGVIPYHESDPMPEEMELLEHQTEDLTIPPRPKFPATEKKLLKFSIAHAANPQEVFVRIHEVKDDVQFEEQEKALDRYYWQDKCKMSMKIKTQRVFVNRPYVWFNKDRGHFERVRVERTDVSLGNVVIHRVDFGNNVLTETKNLYEMHPAYARQHALVHSVFLVHIKPGNEEYWSPAEIQVFQKLLMFSTFYCGVFFPELITTTLGRLKWSSNGVLLAYDYNRYPFTVQAAMVACGSAIGSGLTAGSPCMFHQGLPAIFTKLKTSTRSKIQEPQHHWGSRNYVAQLEGALEDKLISDSIGDMGTLTEIQKLNVNIIDYSEEGLPATLVNMLAWIDICHVAGPGQFYVRLYCEQKNLEKVMSKIPVDRLEACPLTPGEFVLVQYAHHDINNIGFSSCWNRGWILSVNLNRDLAKVLLIDFGLEVSVKDSKIRSMPKECHEIPALCYRCHLVIPSYMPATNGRWSSEAVMKFKAYLEKWKVSYPMYFAFQPRRGVLLLDYYGQDVTYCQEEHDFKAFKDPQLESKCAWMKASGFHETKLCSSYFRSLGIAVYYDDLTEEKYSFEPVWDELKTEGLIVKRG